MNNLEKALLIKELGELISYLSHRNMSLYEIAKSKKRLREIYTLCDEPVFKSQLLAFKSITQPEIAAYEFSRSTPYAHSFRGYFIYDEDLETALYQQPDMGWALLHDPQKGWQMWLIPAPQRTALLSDWSSLAETQIWLEEQQDIYHCLVEDQDLLARAVVLKPQPESIVIQPKTLAEAAEQYSPDTELNHQSYNIPFAPWAEVRLELIEHPQALFKKIYALNIQDDTQQLQDYVKFIGCYKKRTFELNQPVYVSEQLNRQGSFENYLVIIGAHDLDHALDMLETYNESILQKSNILRSLAWSTLIQHLDSIEQLFHCLQTTQIVRQAQQPIEFIPRDLLHTQKFLKFDEKSAAVDTPILVLKERHKIRVIHGEQRLHIEPRERAYPFLLLHRQDGFSWQAIQTVIDQLRHPVDVLQLYQSLTEQKVN